MVYDIKTILLKILKYKISNWGHRILLYIYSSSSLSILQILAYILDQKSFSLKRKLLNTNTKSAALSKVNLLRFFAMYKLKCAPISFTGWRYSHLT
jgi:hypothetical protein